MEQGAVARLVAPRIGPGAFANGEPLDADASLENGPGFLFDALALPGSKTAVAALAQDGHALGFIKDQYRHCKAILALGASGRPLQAAGLPGVRGLAVKPAIRLIRAPPSSMRFT